MKTKTISAAIALAFAFIVTAQAKPSRGSDLSQQARKVESIARQLGSELRSDRSKDSRNRSHSSVRATLYQVSAKARSVASLSRGSYDSQRRISSELRELDRLSGRVRDAIRDQGRDRSRGSLRHSSNSSSRVRGLLSELDRTIDSMQRSAVAMSRDRGGDRRSNSVSSNRRDYQVASNDRRRR